MGLDALSIHRIAKALWSQRVPLLPSVLGKLNLVLFSAYLPPSARIAPGTKFGYGGVGVFVHPRAVIGRGCLVSQFVSLGGYSGKQGAPRIGHYVRIGTGARILGPVRIGDFAVIGANAVVVRDVPAGAVVFGVPARVVRTPADPVTEYEQDTGSRVPEDDRKAYVAALRARGGNSGNSSGNSSGHRAADGARPANDPSEGQPGAPQERSPIPLHPPEGARPPHDHH